MKLKIQRKPKTFSAITWINKFKEYNINQIKKKKKKKDRPHLGLHSGHKLNPPSYLITTKSNGGHILSLNIQPTYIYAW